MTENTNPTLVTPEPIRPVPIGFVYVVAWVVFFITLWLYLPLISAYIPIHRQHSEINGMFEEARLESAWRWIFVPFRRFGIIACIAGACYATHATYNRRLLDRRQLSRWIVIGTCGAAFLFGLVLAVLGLRDGAAALVLPFIFPIAALAMAIPNLIVATVAADLAARLCGTTRRTCTRASVVLAVFLSTYGGLYGIIRFSENTTIEWKYISGGGGLASYAFFELEIETGNYWTERLFMIPAKIEGHIFGPARPVWGPDGYYTPK